MSAAAPTRRFCRCEHPARVVDGDGIAHCDRCGELLPVAMDLVLPLLVRSVARLDRRVEALDRRLSGAGVSQ